MSDKRNMGNRSRVSHRIESPKSPFVDDISKNFDCLKTSILIKASRLCLSNEFDKVTLGPDADLQNGHISNNTNENNSKTSSPALNGMPSSRSNITFSIKKILLENEIQRREKVKKAVEQKKLEMEKSKKEIQDELSEILSRLTIQREKESAEKLARLEAEEEQLAQQLEIDRKNEVQRLRLKESEEISKKIIPFRKSFYAKWKDIVNISKNCRDKNSASRLLAPHAAKLKELSIQMEAVNEKTSSGDVTAADIKMTEIIVQCIDEVFHMFKTDIDEIDAIYEKEIARREVEVKRAELAAQEEALRIKQMQEMQNTAQPPQQCAAIVTQEIKNNQQSVIVQNQPISEIDSSDAIPQLVQEPNIVSSNAPTVTTVNNAPILSTPSAVPTNESISENAPENASKYCDNESLKIYVGTKQFLDIYVSSYQEFLQSNAMKKFRVECQKMINITINAVSHTNREQLIDKYEKLKLFLLGKGNPNILLNSQAEIFSKSLLAQKIVDQGDTTISSKPELAFPFAAIAVALWNDWPDFGSLLLARFRIKAPFFVPVFLLPENNQSEEEYLKILGYKFNEDGTLEKPDQFWKRLSGLMYLYASILITRQKKGIDKPHPFGLGNAWRWLAATINTEPRIDTANVCATLIFVMLEVTGDDLWKTYPTQFPKLLQTLYNVYYKKLKTFDLVIDVPIQRLGDFLATALKKGSIPPPKGQLPPNFW